MAVDSALKRSSATLVLSPGKGWAFPGTSGVSAAERMAITWMYAGIAAGTPAGYFKPVGNLLGVYRMKWIS